jgi:WD40 repeat protein
MIEVGSISYADIECILDLPSYFFSGKMLEDMYEILTEADFIKYKSIARNPQLIIEDYELVLNSDAQISSSKREDLRLIQGAICLAADSLQKNSSQFTGQLWGRLLSFSSPRIKYLTKQIKNTENQNWLCLLTPSLIQPNKYLSRRFVKHTESVNTLCFVQAPEVLKVISGSCDGTIKVWNLDTGELLLQLGLNNKVRFVAVSSNAKIVVSSSFSEQQLSYGILKAWDLSTGQKMYEFEDELTLTKSFLITPDNKFLIQVSDKKAFKLRELETGQEIASYSEFMLQKKDRLREAVEISLSIDGFTNNEFFIKDAKGEIMGAGAAITPDGKQVIIGQKNGDIIVHSFEELLKGNNECFLLKGHNKSVNEIVVTPDGKTLISASDDTTIKGWDLKTRTEIFTLAKSAKPVSSVSVSQDMRFIVSGSSDKSISIWNFETRELLKSITQSDLVRTVRIIPNRGQFISTLLDGSITLWNLEASSDEPLVENHADRVMGIAITHDEKRAISVSHDETMKIWDLKTGDCLRTYSSQTSSSSKHKLNGVALTPNDRFVFSGATSSFIIVWDLEGEEWWKYPDSLIFGHPQIVGDIAVTPDGSKVISASQDETLKIWSVSTQNELHTLKGHSYWVNGVTVTPDGQKVVSASEDKSIIVWDLSQGSKIHQLWGHESGVNTVAVTPDSKKIVSGSDDKKVKVWDIETGVEILNFAGHTDRVNALAITQDGLNVVSVSDDNTLKIWSLSSEKCIMNFNFDSKLYCCAISGNGERIIVGDSSGKVHFLSLESPGVNIN